MPVKRDMSNGPGFFQWVETGSSYKTDFTDYSLQLIADGEVLPEDFSCMVSLGGDKMLATSCNESYPGICAYKIRAGWVSNDFCDVQACAQKDFFNNSQCVCKGEVPEVPSSDVEFLTRHDNNAFEYHGDACNIALEKLENGTYIWTQSRQEISYTFWSVNTVFDDNHIYGAATYDSSWVLTEAPLQCSLYLFNITLEEPVLNLTLTNTILTLQIINVKSLKQVADIPVYCFTNAEATSILYRYSKLRKISKTDTFMVVEFEVLSEPPSHYWCEGFRFFDSTVVTSNTVLSELENEFSEFVIILSVSCNSGTDPLSQSTINFVDSTLFRRFKNDDVLKFEHTLRVMKFIKAEYDNCTALVNVHSTSTNLIGEQDDFIGLKVLVQGIVSTIEGMEMVDFLSASYCCKDDDGKLTWPQTQLGFKSTPSQFCFTKDATLVTRLCDGTFIDGARWSDYEDCEILPKSKLSSGLFLALTDNNKDKETKVYETSMDYSEIKPLDLYLIGEILKTLDLSTTKVQVVAKSVNNILQIPDKNVFKEAQLKTRATDTILNFLDNIVMNYNGTFDVGLINFIFSFLEIKDLSGLVVLEHRYVEVLQGEHTIDDVQGISDSRSGILVNSVRNESQKVAFSVFFNDNFFTEDVDVPHDIDIVYRVVLPQGATVKIFHRVEYDEKVQHCLRWNSTGNTSTWTISGEPQVHSSFGVCEHSNSGYFGIAIAPADIKNDNITHDLIDVLTSNDTSSVTIKRLSDISESYNFFKPVDVSFVGKILEKVSTDQINLKHLAKTVSNIQKTNKKVLFESQMEDRGTDNILRFVDDILKLQDQQHTQIHDDNFMIFINNSPNFRGIVLLSDENSVRVKILSDNSSLDDILRYDNFDSAVIIDPALQTQMGNGTKIIITVFKNDALFNQENPQQLFVSKIFGIILPEIGDYLGPVSVLYKISAPANTSDHCVHWYYDKSVTGFWKNDSTTNSTPFGVSQCDFWHTTHFAVLVVDTKSIDIDPTGFDFLDVVVTVNSVVSLVGLNLIVFTAILFKQWRSNTGNQILLNFVFILIFQISAFYVSSTITLHDEHYLLCVGVGVVLHYCTISQFFWMLVVAVLQFRRLVVVLKAPPTRVLLKACLFGWVLPLVPVITVLIVDKDSYVRSNGLCYPSEWSLYLGVWLPVSIVVTINSAIFVNILYNVINKKSDVVDAGNSEMIYQVRLAVLLFFMFGLTWVFGFLSNFHNAEVFVYLFCCTTSLQGFVIFLFFVVCNPNTKYLYVRRCCQTRDKK